MRGLGGCRGLERCRGLLGIVRRVCGSVRERLSGGRRRCERGNLRWWNYGKPLGSNAWPIALLQSVVFRVLGDKTSSFLLRSCPPSSSNPSSSSHFFHYLPLLLNLPSKTLGSLTRSRSLNRGTGKLTRPCWHWHVRRYVEGAREELDWGRDVELVGEGQEVGLSLSLLLEWSLWASMGDTFSSTSVKKRS